MSVFEEIKLSFGGKEYTIPPDRVMSAIGRVENVITLGELGEMAEKPKVALKLMKLAKAYGELLRYAGATVTDEDVYAGMFSGGTSNVVAMQALLGLLALMMPPASMRKATEPPGEGNRQARRAGASLSRKPSKRLAPRKAPADGE